jgi:hypothetical protein
MIACSFRNVSNVRQVTIIHSTDGWSTSNDVDAELDMAVTGNDFNCLNIASFVAMVDISAAQGTTATFEYTIGYKAGHLINSIVLRHISLENIAMPF